ncbi:MAG: putative inorganic carbon transporter subunit DabA, partial [Pirellulaceae bacterium]
MSALDAFSTTPGNVPHQPTRSASHPRPELPARGTSIREVVEQVRQKIAPVWPLNDYVAVNPYVGYVDQEFLTARTSLRSVSDLETLLPVAYYREQFAAGSLCRADIDAAVDEMVADGVAGAERIDVNQVVALLRQPPAASPAADTVFPQPGNPGRVLRTLADVFDQHTGSAWSRLILDEISKHCASHYDEGQAFWPSPTRELPLYHAWKLAASHDRSFEMLGVAGMRKLATGLPHDPHAAVVALLKQLSVPEGLWADLLLCEALTMPGWCAWVNYQYTQSQRRGEENTDLAGLLAMRLAHEVALSIHFDFHVDWASVATCHHARLSQASQPTDEDLMRYALLKASEIAFRKQLLAGLAGRADRPRSPAADRPMAQLVFCIDVRSERMRRHIESESPAIETFGFAGFFGLPIEFVGLGESHGRSQVPVLIAPQFRVREEVDGEDTRSRHSTIQRRSLRRFLRGTWKEFQRSAAGCFA